MGARRLRFPGTALRGYAAAILAVALAGAVKILLRPATVEPSPFLGFFAAVVLSAWYGGAGPGVAATLLAAWIAGYCFMRPEHAVLRSDANQNLQLLWFVLECLLATWLCVLLRAARRRAETAAREARESRDRLRSNEQAHQQHAEQFAEANRLKDEFLATVSHELRTPLNSILGWVQLFRGGKLDETGRAHALETIEDNAKIQARLIDDLLDISRIVTGKMRLEVRVVRLSDVVEAAVETVRPAAQAKEIALRTRFDPHAGAVFGDAKRLQQVAWNLLSNAIKFTPRGGSVEVRLARRGAQVEWTVRDTGSGIRADFLPHVFDAFRQADSSSTRTHKGLGLGLDIVRRLVELHGGTVQAESAGEGQGALFRVRLPAAPTPVQATPQLPVDGALPALQGVRVVLVDDDPGARELLSAVLTRCGVEVTAAASAAEALLAVRRVRPHVLLSDIEMPGEDGYALIRKVRQLAPDDGGRTPALALTAYTRTEDRSRALQAGFQVHLSKPVDSEELVAAVATLAAQPVASE